MGFRRFMFRGLTKCATNGTCRAALNLRRLRVLGVRGASYTPVQKSGSAP